MTHPSATLEPTQRRITLLRHAKAVADERGDDHGRILAPQGKEAAVALGDWLRENDLLPELVLCSTAARTRETLAALNAILPTELHKSLYLGSAGDMLALLHKADDAVRHIMIVGHNPGMHAMAATMARGYVREADADAIVHRYPTCGLVSMSLPAVHWRDATPQTGIVDVLRFDGID